MINNTNTNTTTTTTNNNDNSNNNNNSNNDYNNDNTKMGELEFGGHLPLTGGMLDNEDQRGYMIRWLGFPQKSPPENRTLCIGLAQNLVSILTFKG